MNPRISNHIGEIYDERNLVGAWLIWTLRIGHIFHSRIRSRFSVYAIGRSTYCLIARTNHVKIFVPMRRKQAISRIRNHCMVFLMYGYFRTPLIFCISPSPPRRTPCRHHVYSMAVGVSWRWPVRPTANILKIEN